MMRPVILDRVVLLALISCGATLGADLRVTGGLADYQVLQRGPDARANFVLTGTAAGLDGKGVEARLTRKHMVVAGFDWAQLAKVQSGTWRGEIKGVPTGGPYRVELRAGPD